MNAQYILRKSLCRPESCGPYDIKTRESEIENMNWANEYAEPGYRQPDKSILFANWNMFSRDVLRLLKQYGYELEWSDEWTTCGGCGKALRTQADSYCWQPSYFWVNECEILCIDCLDVEKYLEGLEDNPDKALNDHINPAKYGYEKLEGNFESGLHPGQNDKPKDIYKRLHEQGHARLLFNIDEQSQFYITFSVWKKVEE